MKRWFIILLILILLSGGAFAGWYFWDKHQKTNNSSQNQSNSQIQGDYLVIKEWGVRFKNPQDLNGHLYYGIRKHVDLEYTSETTPVYGDVAYFASKILSSISKSCDLIRDSSGNIIGGGPGVALSRSTVKPNPYSQVWDFNVDGYWYSISKGSASTCYSGSNGQKEASFKNSLMQALKTIRR